MRADVSMNWQRGFTRLLAQSQKQGSERRRGADPEERDTDPEERDTVSLLMTLISFTSPEVHCLLTETPQIPSDPRFYDHHVKNTVV